MTWLKHRRGVYDARQRHVNDVCRRYDVTETTYNNTFEDTYNRVTSRDQGRFVERVDRKKFVLARSSQIMGCFVNKVASSSFVKTFLALEGLKVEKITSPHAYKPKLTPSTDQEFHFSKTNFYKVLFVRNPMERLVSCYYDKMLVGTHKSLKAFRKAVKIRARRLMSKLTIQYQHSLNDENISKESDFKQRQKRSTNESSPHGDANFRRRQNRSSQASNEELIKNLNNSLNQTEPLLTNRSQGQDEFQDKDWANFNESSSDDMNDTNSVITPTFEEFLVYILSTDLQGEGFSSHWVPYWRQCTPCHFEYDMIGKLETGLDDFTYLWKRSSIDLKVPIPLEHVGISTEINKSDLHKQKMRSFYKSVPRDLLVRVHEAYKLDFELFGYDFNEVLTLAGYEPLT